MNWVIYSNFCFRILTGASCVFYHESSERVTVPSDVCGDFLSTVEEFYRNVNG